VTDYVTVEDLAAVLGAQMDQLRADAAVAAANELVGHWTAPTLDAEPPADAVTPAQRQAGLELAQTLYRRHAGTGATAGPEELLAQLPAELVAPIRELLDADTHRWGIA
jgi:hypothetical protein